MTPSFSPFLFVEACAPCVLSLLLLPDAVQYAAVVVP